MVTTTLLLLSALSLPPAMDVGDIRPGQTGECLTVFEGPGDNVEAFPFVVKGVMPSYLGPGRDLVMIRLQGEKAEFTGVVAGMSGSPCSIDGKLVGALSYSFASFAKEPIAGVTPIGDMLDVLELPNEPAPWRVPGVTTASSGGDEDWQSFRAGKPLARNPAPEGLLPIAAPLAMGGVPPTVRQHFAPYLESLGFLPVAAGGGVSARAKPKRLKPGGAVATVFVEGDVNIGSLCTVTTVEKNAVTACGHPIFGTGVTSMPMANAMVINTMASSMRSFKQFIAGATLGEFTEDRLPAIGGVMGRTPKTVAATGSITTPAGESKFSFNVARDLRLTPRFVAIGLASSLSGRIDAGQRGLVRFRGTVNVDGREPVIVEDVYSGERDPGLFIYSAIDVAQAVGALWNTGFGPPPEMTVTLEAEVRAEPIEERIEEIYLDRGVVRAGEPFNVTVRLRKENGRGVNYETFGVQVPRTWAGSEVDLIAASAFGAESVAAEVEGRPKPQKIEQVIRYLNKRRGDGYLYFMAVRKGPGLSTEVDSYAFLPPSAVATLASGSPYNTSRAAGLAWEERRERPGVVSGAAALTLKVEQPK